MMQAADMFRTHPRQSQVEFSLLAKCVDECYACAPTCTTYANVCLGRANVAELVRCKYLNEDCEAACLLEATLASFEFVIIDLASSVTVAEDSERRIL